MGIITARASLRGRVTTPTRGCELCSLARYAKHNANFVLVVSGSLKLKAKSTEKVIEVVYDLLVKAIQLSSLVRLEFGVRPVGLK
jgi:hypothetical protein